MTDGSDGTVTGQPDRAQDEPDSQPLVSAVIPTYNRPSYLRKAVESVRDQTYDSIELVVVDDHSEEPAREELAEMELNRFVDVTCIRHEENRGVNGARNTGIDVAAGEFVAFLDDDDRWVPEKIERQVARFRDTGDDVGVVYTGVRNIKADRTHEMIPPAVEGDITKALLCRNVVGSMSVVMVRTELAESVRLDDRFPSWADLEWYVNLSRHADFERIPEPLVVYESRSHNRLSADVEKKGVAYELFVDEFAPLAKEYGALFARKMHGWAAFRFGSSAYYRGHYAQARRYLALAVVLYPLEPQFFVLLFASLGGKPVHRTIRFAREIDT